MKNIHRITESQNRIGWKRPLRSSSPTVNLTLPRPPLNHVPKHLIQMSFKYLQGWQLNHFPGQPLPMLDNPFSEVKFPNIQSKPPLAQLEAFSSCPITCYLGEETDPHLSTTSFQVVVESDKVSPEPPFLQAKQSQLPQPLLIRLLLQTLHQLRCPSLDTLQHLNVSLVVRGPKLNTVFEVRPHQCRVQGHDHFPSPAGHAIFDTGQDAIGLLGRLGTLLAHIQAAVNQHSQALLCQAAFQPLFPKPVALHGVAVAQVQDLALGLVEPHTIGLGPSIQPVQVPLQSLPTLKQINTPAQLGVICKLTADALDPFVQIIDKDIKQDWPQITECLRLERTSGGQLVQPPCSSRATYSKFPRTMSRQILNISKLGDSTTSTGSLCQCSVTFVVQKCFLMFRGNLLCFRLCPLPLVLSPGTNARSLAPFSLHPPFKYLYILMRSIPGLLFSRLNNPRSLSLSAQERCSKPFIIIFMALYWTHSSMSMSRLYCGAQNWTQHSRCGLTSAV
ncbi:hypothetical protein QYF61_021871 [Mycteria americana]|uniref:Uncharacterized protein n=1 Tax=Mycteria americana TaxID=33587 RepID=A0AAN7PKB8_MYCAM|nr:hypothetical protein QYF61_021871 [Mycteria americana]